MFNLLALAAACSSPATGVPAAPVPGPATIFHHEIYRWHGAKRDAHARHVGGNRSRPEPCDQHHLRLRRSCQEQR
jgi:hypothetical protein